MKSLTATLLATAFLVHVHQPLAQASEPLVSQLRLIQFRPATPQSITQSAQSLRSAIDGLAPIMQSPAGPSWRDYMLLDQVTAHLQPPLDDLEEMTAYGHLLSRAYFRMVALHDGIDRHQFMQYRNALREFRTAVLLFARQSDDADKLEFYEEFKEDLLPKEREQLRPFTLQDEFRREKTALVEVLESSQRDYRKLRRLARALRWMRTYDQHTQLMDRVSGQLGGANLSVQLRSDALREMTVRPVHEVEPINRTEDDVRIRGQAVVDGFAYLVPVSGNQRGRLEARFDGQVLTSLNGRQGPVSFDLTGFTALNVQKPVTVDSDRIRPLESVAQANTNLRTDRVCSKFSGGLGKLVRKFAAKEISEQRPQASRDLSKESAESFIERFDEEIAIELDEAQRDLDEELHRSLRKLNLSPSLFQFLSDPSALSIDFQFGDGISSALATSSQHLPAHDLHLRVHESSLNEILRTPYSGKSISRFQNELQLLGIEMDQSDLDDLPEDLGIRFAIVDPITVSYDESTLSVTLRADEWIIGDSGTAAMNATITYGLTQQDTGRYYMRLAGVTVSAPNAQPAPTFLAERPILVNNLRDNLDEEIEFDPINVTRLPDMVDRLGSLSWDWMKISDGWFQATLRGDRVSPDNED